MKSIPANTMNCMLYELSWLYLPQQSYTHLQTDYTNVLAYHTNILLNIDIVYIIIED